MKNIYKSIVKFIKENENPGAKYYDHVCLLICLLCTIGLLVVLLPLMLYMRYEERYNGTVFTGVVIDNNFSSSYKYLIRLKDNGRRISLEGDDAESKILIGDSVAVNNNSSFPGEYFLLYFFDSAIDERYLPDTVYYRRKFDEKRNYINL